MCTAGRKYTLPVRVDRIALSSALRMQKVRLRGRYTSRVVSRIECIMLATVATRSGPVVLDILPVC